MTTPKTETEQMVKIYEAATFNSIAENPQGTRMDVILLAMSEYAAQQSRSQAIAFAEWMRENTEPSHNSGQWVCKPWDNEWAFSYTPAELYDLFLIEQAKKEI